MSSISDLNKEQSVQRMFSSIARFYDLNNTLLSFGLHHRWKHRTIKAARLKSGDRVADIGAGTADLSILAAKKIGDRGRVTAVDLNEAMLRIGKKKVQGTNGGIGCVIGSAERLPLPDAAYDAVVTGFCLRNVSDLDRALSEIYRTLKPGGRMVCLEFSRPERKILRRLYDFYSFTLLPKVGTWVSRDKTGVYQYLPDSIRKFPAQKELKERMEKHGFKDVAYENLSGGIVAIHVGLK